MMCFRDMSFCSSSHICGNTKCHRNFTDEVRAQAETWWNPTGDPDKKDGAPIGMMDFKTDCPDYQPAKVGWDYPATQRTQPKEN